MLGGVIFGCDSFRVLGEDLCGVIVRTLGGRVDRVSVLSENESLCNVVCEGFDGVFLVGKGVVFEKELLDALSSSSEGDVLAAVDGSVDAGSLPRVGGDGPVFVGVMYVGGEALEWLCRYCRDFGDVDSVLEALSQVFRVGLVGVEGFAWWRVHDERGALAASWRLKLARERERLRDKRVFLFDLDGTLVLGRKPIGGAGEFLDFLKRSELKPVVVTNNSSLTRDDVLVRIRDILGVVLEEDEVYSSVEFFASRFGGSGRFYYLLPRRVVEYYGLEHCWDDPEECDGVAVGFDRELTYGRLADASLLLQKGKRFLLIHPDLRYPSEEGFLPDAGSIARLLEAVTGRSPEWVGGKPSGEFIGHYLSSRGYSKSESVYFGDRLYTDVKMGLESGIDVVLVLTGETGISDIDEGFLLRDGVFVARDLVEYALLVYGVRLGRVDYRGLGL